MNQPNQSNQSNVSRETLRTPSSYKVQAVKNLLDSHPYQFFTVLTLLVSANWDEAKAKSFIGHPSTKVAYLPIGDLRMGLYFAPSANPSQGIGMHLLVVKSEEPTHVLFIGFHEFSIISQIVAGIGQMKLVKGVDECREVKTRQWVMSNVDRLSHRIVACLFGHDLKELYALI